MPHAGALAPLDLIRPDRALDTIKRTLIDPLFAFPQFALAFVQMLETFCQVWAVLDCQRDQEGPQGGFLGLDGLPPCQ